MSTSSNNKGPLDQFYRDCLRVGNLKVRRAVCVSVGQTVKKHAHASATALLPRHSGSAVPPLLKPTPSFTAHMLLLISPSQCFTNFSLYLKGREELVVTIFHGLLSPRQQPPINRVGSVGCAVF